MKEQIKRSVVSLLIFLGVLLSFVWTKDMAKNIYSWWLVPWYYLGIDNLSTVIYNKLYKRKTK